MPQDSVLQHLRSLPSAAFRCPSFVGRLLGIICVFAISALGSSSLAQPGQYPWQPKQWSGAEATPSFRILKGAPVSPAAAVTALGTGTTSTDGVCRDNSGDASLCPSGGKPRPPEIKELARALRQDPDLIYEYVQNSIDTEFVFGSRRGALGTIIDRSGSPFDQANLMVEVLRESGITARYRFGDITLTGAQFSNWTGIDQAKAACEYLAAGGMPATVNGSADCNVSGAVTGVVMLHVWVEAVISGQTYQFDPSFKTYTNVSGIDVRAGMGFQTGDVFDAAIAGSTLSGDGKTLSGMNGGGSLPESYLAAFLTRLQQSDLQGADITDVVGGRRIEAAVRPVGGWRQSSLAHVTQVRQTWSGGIPNQYRMSLTLKAYADGGTSPIEAQLYADEVYGRRIEIDYYRTEPYSVEPKLRLDDRLYSAGAVSGSPPSAGFYAIVSVNHPFAAQSGAYADGSITRHLGPYTPGSLNLVLGVGQTSGRLGAKWGAEWTGDYESSDLRSGKMARALLGAGWLEQFSQAAWLHAQLANSRETHLHSLGFAFQIYNPCNGSTEPACTPPKNDAVTLLDIETAFGLTQRTNDVEARRAAVLAIAASGATLEGSVGEQRTDSPDSISTARRFAYNNGADDEPHPGQTSLFYRIGVGDSVPALSAFSPASPPAEVIGADTRPALVSALSAYHTAGFDIVTASDVLTGPGYDMGAVSDYGPDLRYPSTQRGGAFVAVKYEGAEPVQIAHVATNFYTSSKGGGVREPTVGVKDTAELIKDRFVDRSVSLGVDLKSGSVGFTSPVVRSIGHGEFPFRLNETLSIRGGGLRGQSMEAYASAQSPSLYEQRVSGGLVSSFDGAAEFSNSGMVGLGASRIDAAAWSIVSFVLLQDVYREAAGPQREVAALLIADNWARGLLRNVVTIQQGAEAAEFVSASSWWSNSRLYLPANGGPTRVSLTGQAQVVRPTYGTGAERSYRIKLDSPISVVWKDGFGGQRAYQYWFYGNYNGPGPGDDPSIYRLQHVQGFRLQTWSFGNGVVLTLQYPAPPTLPAISLTAPSAVPISVSSNLGYTLQLSPAPIAELAKNNFGSTPPPCRTLAPGGIATSFAPDSPGYFEQVFATASGQQYRLRFGRSTTWTIGQRPVDVCQLKEVYTPSRSASPAIRYTYDSLGRVKEGRDALAIDGSRAPQRFYLAEGYRGEREDAVEPVGGRYAVEWIDGGRRTRTIDELGRVTVTQLDGRDRVLSRTYPEGNQDVFTYDARDNTLTLTQVGKPGSGLQKTTTMSFVESASVRECANFFTCNRLATTDGPRTDLVDVTNFSWDAATGNLTQILKPSDASGVRPQIDLGYTTFGNGVSLMTTRTEKINSTTDTMTTFSYDAADKYKLKSSTVDPAGLNLRTCIEYNATGDIVGISDPRATSCPGVP